MKHFTKQILFILIAIFSLSLLSINEAAAQRRSYRSSSKSYSKSYSYKPSKSYKSKRSESYSNPRKQSYSSGETYRGREVHVGPRGGRYYINKNGNKTYIK
ncbi:MAG: hypothetical protein EOO20_09635 [Chryseobacterium sp.]|nr:MAG: hypothetical protein EOO20_09635 [Chryseobacterium sp.]